MIGRKVTINQKSWFVPTAARCCPLRTARSMGRTSLNLSASFVAMSLHGSAGDQLTSARAVIRSSVQESTYQNTRKINYPNAKVQRNALWVEITRATEKSTP